MALYGHVQNVFWGRVVLAAALLLWVLVVRRELGAALLMA